MCTFMHDTVRGKCAKALDLVGQCCLCHTLNLGSPHKTHMLRCVHETLWLGLVYKFFVWALVSLISYPLICSNPTQWVRLAYQ